MLSKNPENQSPHVDRRYSPGRLQTLGAALLSGLLLAAVFPKWDQSYLLPLALVPLMWAIRPASPRRAFWLGFISGLAGYLALLYWIIYVTVVYGGLPWPLGLGVLLLLAGYLSLYRGLWALGVAWAEQRGLNLLWFAPALWVALELGQTHLLFGGFPWELLGYGLYRVPILLQVADLTGVYGLSFLLILVNVGLWQILSPGPGRRQRRLLSLPVLGFTLLGWLSYGVYGLETIKNQENASRKLKVAVVQGNIKQGDKWNPQIVRDTLEQYRNLTARVKEARLIVWPETAAPFLFRPATDLSALLEAIGRESGGYLLFGSLTYEKNPGADRFFNSAYLLNPRGQEAGRYDKNHLVPFGEYIPLQRFLPFISKMVPMIGDFSQGPAGTVLTLPEGAVGPLICFESIFPDLSRDQVRNGARLLVNITNDAWFGTTSAPYQHLSMAVLRAVENRVCLVRAANTGFSAFIGADGRLLWRSGLFVAEAQAVELPWLPGGSFYSRFGDVFAWGCVLIAIIGFALTTIRPKTAA